MKKEPGGVEGYMYSLMAMLCQMHSVSLQSQIFPVKWKDGQQIDSIYNGNEQCHRIMLVLWRLIISTAIN